MIGVPATGAAVTRFSVGDLVEAAPRTHPCTSLIGTIKEVPVHPNTWFKVQFADRRVCTFRSSALRRVASGAQRGKGSDEDEPVNLPGGTATIKQVHDERVLDGGPMRDGSEARTTGFTYAVKYVLGGSEKRVDAQHLRKSVETEGRRSSDTQPAVAPPSGSRPEKEPDVGRRVWALFEEHYRFRIPPHTQSTPSWSCILSNWVDQSGRYHQS